MQTPSGFHIVKLNETRAAGGAQIIQQVHLRHILLKTTEIEDDATVRQKLTHMARADRLGQGGFRRARQDQLAGSQLGHQRRGSGLDRGRMPSCRNSPAVAESLKHDEISQPFRTQYGWHIVQMLGHRDFDNTAEAARERAFEALRDSRVEEATELWLQQIRDESYVELRL